jgi:hypothetical protein
MKKQLETKKKGFRQTIKKIGTISIGSVTNYGRSIGIHIHRSGHLYLTIEIFE